MEAIRHFRHCPRCGADAVARADVSPGGPFRCETCGFTLFFNAAAAAAALMLRDDGRALFIRRAKDPGRGQLGMPGGFVDPGEDVESALRREVREEVGLDVEELRYLTSHANRYVYAGVTYHTVDLFYMADVPHPDRAGALDAVESVAWFDPLTVSLDTIAFDSMRHALEHYRRLVSSS
jgi:ADP-ribose pyrophosphatase YjhB (NUDIX family)